MAGRAEDSPHLQLLIGSPGIRVLEWALSRAPVPGMRHITDPHPLTR
jgi:nitrous oxidase accessory protein NosD